MGDTCQFNLNDSAETQGVLLLNVEQVALSLGMCTRTIWRLHDQGKLPKAVRIGRAVRWKKADIVEWVKRI